MKIRYATQIRESDCGPIALLNLLKWLGMRVTVREHHGHLCWMCNLIDGFGSSDSDLTRALSHLRRNNFSFKYRRKPKLKTILSHLKNGGAVILVYPNEVGLHACFIPSQNKKKISVVNAFVGKAVNEITMKTLEKWVSSANSSAWLISKN